MSYLLFADDNEDMRLMVRDLLQSIGHEVALAPDGLTALAAVQAREPDLMILDPVRFLQASAAPEGIADA